MVKAPSPKRRRGAGPAKPKPAAGPTTTTSRPHGRSLDDFEPLLPAEKKLLECCRTGELAVIGDERPEEEGGDNGVRAAFVRFLVLGGGDRAPVHEQGVQLHGAWLSGTLDLEAAEAERPLWLFTCRIERIKALQAKLVILGLSGCRLESGLEGDRLSCAGAIFLRNGFHSAGAVRLLGATIGGDLDCTNALFENPGEQTLVVDGAQIAGSLILARGFSSVGTVRLNGTQIGGDVNCEDGSFENPDGIAFACDGALIARRLLFRSVRKLTGSVVLSVARVGTLCDDLESWNGAGGGLWLDGLIYDRLAGGAPTDSAARLAWLDLQFAPHLGEDFRPGPWEQLVRVLREMGHPDEARAIAVEKQNRLRRVGQLPRGTHSFHWLYGALVGYGYRPMRLLAVTGAVWLFCAIAYWWAANPGPLGASTHLVGPPASEGKVPTGHYANFVPLIYSADVLLPVVDLGYKDEWRPVVSKDGKPLLAGQILRFLYWFEIAFGWVAGLLLVGVLGNLIKKD